MISHAQVDTSLSTLSSPVCCLLSPLSSNVSLNLPLSAHFFPLVTSAHFTSASQHIQPFVSFLDSPIYALIALTVHTYIYIYINTQYIQTILLVFFLLSVLRRATHFTVTLRCSTAVIDTRTTCFSFLVPEFVNKQFSFRSKRN